MRLLLQRFALAAALAAGLHAADARACEERLAEGDERPGLEVTLDPPKALAGHRVDLVVKVTHGAGETVLPREASAAEAAEAITLLKGRGLALVEAGGRVASSAVREGQGGKRETELRFHLVPLPEKPGPQPFEVPALPITLGRPSGRTATVCTKPVAFTAESPTASAPNAEARPNAGPLPQREPFTALRWALAVLGTALLLAPLLLWLWKKWKSRPAPVVEAPPPPPHWVVAKAALDALATSGLVEAGRFDEFFDRVSDIVRRYLGDRFGFDGLESTSDEVVRALRKHPIGRAHLEAARGILEEADLAKFARAATDASRCGLTIDRARQLVDRVESTPTEAPRPAAPPMNTYTDPRARRGGRP